MSESLKIGQIIETPQNRDAIHVAVAPVVANSTLIPGEHIGLLPDGTASANPPFIGVVDPFLTRRVQAGETFWMFLKPGSITSLRHEWTHPGFDGVQQVPVTDTQIGTKAATERSEKWIREYADNLNLTYNDLLLGADEWVRDRSYLCRGENLEGEYTSDEFWAHYEVVRGVDLGDESKCNFFTCSC